MMESTLAPPPRSYIEVRRGRQSAVGRVAWRKDVFFGVRAQDRLDVAAWVDEPRLAAKPSLAPSGEARPSERRIDPQRLERAKIGERHERGKRYAAAFQFVAIVAAGACLAVFIAIQVGDILSAPIAVIESSLPH